jgi:Flp pilus assembly protein TadG
MLAMSRRAGVPIIFLRNPAFQEGGTVRRRGDERGAALVEFALVLPVLILFVFGIVEFGRAYSARIQLTSAVREGARAVALGGDGVAATRNGAPGLDPALSTSQVTANSCSGATPPPNAVVRATYPFNYTIPLFRTGTWTLSATGVMRCGG